jgi:hypothetical protein
VAVPPVTPPSVFPAPWQTGHTFSECFLLYVQEEAVKDLLRTIGCALFDAFLNASLPEFPEGVTVAELRAAVADLRHLQGYLAGVGREHEEAPLTEPETVLSQLAARQAVELARVADEIELALDIAADGKGAA